MRTSDAVVGQWERVFTQFGLPWTTGNRHIDCPICSKKKSFRIDDKDGRGTWICTCSAGTGWDLLMRVTGKDFRMLAKEIDLIIGNTQDYTRNAPRVPRANDSETVRDYFLALPKIKGTQANQYLNSRGIYDTPGKGIRYSTGEYDHDERRKIPCMYAIASDEYGAPAIKHITYLEGGKKADIETQRKMFTIKETHGPVAIKFSPAGSILGIAEGIESALSAAHIYKMPVWSKMSAAIMQRFRSPPGVKALYIFADNDKNGTGLAAAFAAGRANILGKNDVEKVFIRWPISVNDFNDMLTGGDDVAEWILTKN